MKPILRTIYLFCLCTILLFSCNRTAYKNTQVNHQQPPNIIFIAIDDLRPALGCYGNKIVQSPRLDEIAATGTLFTNHFVQVPTCGASRASLLTGMYPKTIAHLRNDIIAETIATKKEESTVPETFIHHLKRNGYYTVGIGKISHSADGYVYGYEEEVSDVKELPYSWDEIAFNAGKWNTGWNAFFAYADGENRQSMKKQVKPYEKGKVGDEGYPDGLTSTLAVQKLKELQQRKQPFFLGVGFFKPHLPFNAPKKYWDLYDPEAISISPNPFLPANVHEASLHNNGEFNQYQLGEEKAYLNKPVSKKYAQKLKHAYYASISYIDAQVGRIVDELELLGLAENTIIVVWGDHGWHLGDQQIWGKHTLFENALKSTLIVKVPNMKRNRKVVNSIVETVDIYPTIVELAGLKVEHPIDGNSFLSAINGKRPKARKAVAYSYFRDGITLRTKRYRLTKYYNDTPARIELYDHRKDKNETINIATKKTSLVKRLLPLLEQKNNGIYDLNK